MLVDIALIGMVIYVSKRLLDLTYVQQVVFDLLALNQVCCLHLHTDLHQFFNNNDCMWAYLKCLVVSCMLVTVYNSK